jgi:hypothetical protein
VCGSSPSFERRAIIRGARGRYDVAGKQPRYLKYAAPQGKTVTFRNICRLAKIFRRRIGNNRYISNESGRLEVARQPSE